MNDHRDYVHHHSCLGHDHESSNGDGGGDGCEGGGGDDRTSW